MNVKCYLFFNFWNKVEKGKYNCFFICLTEFPSETVQSWTSVCRDIFITDLLHFWCSDWSNCLFLSWLSVLSGCMFLEFLEFLKVFSQLFNLLQYNCSKYHNFFCISVVLVVISPLLFFIVFIWVLFFFFFIVNLDKVLSVLFIFSKTSSWFHWSFQLF